MNNAATSRAVDLLQRLIEVPSMSGDEDKAVEVLERYFAGVGIPVERYSNNLVARNAGFDHAKPSLLLNSHLDTVQPNASWSRDPFKPVIADGRLYGLGSNDAGGPLVCLIQAFQMVYSHNNPAYNVVFAATAEEEISGVGGIESILTHLGNIEFAVVGEPTGLDLAVAEKGLMVLDCAAYGVSGHAAREEGQNAIYSALPDIEWFRTYRFPKESALLGPVKMAVTMIGAGTQHNVVPDICRYTVDVRTTDAYSNAEVLGIIRQHVHAEVTPRSTRLEPSGLPEGHMFWEIARKHNLRTFGSPTLSDQALLRCPSVKTGPGDSARSHTADEYITLDEIEKGIDHYVLLINGILHTH
jgi:acetylornithine deacetylase